MKKRIAQLIVRSRYFLLVILLVASVFAGLSIGKTRINYDLTRYLSKDTMTQRALVVMDQEFGSAEQLRLMFVNQSKEQVTNYVNALNEMPEVLLASHNEETDSLRDGDRTYALVSVTLDDCDPTEAVKTLRQKFPEAGTYYVGGSAASQLDIQASVGDEIPVVMIIAVLVVFLMLLVTSHAWLEPPLILLVLAVSIVINMGTNFIFSDVSFITFAVSAILQLALSIDYAIMLLHTFNGYREDGLEAKDAMVEALSECFMRISSSALTTIAGLLSLLFMSYTIGFDIGIVLSKGILCTLLGVFLLMPSVILLFEKPLRRSKHKPLSLGGAHLGNWISKIKTPLAIFMLLLVLLGAFFSFKVSYSFTSSEEKAKGDTAFINSLFGTTNPLVLLVPGGEKDEDYNRQKKTVNKLLALTREDGSPVVSSVSSMVTTGKDLLKYYTISDVVNLTGQSEANVRLFFSMQGFGKTVRGDKLLSKAAQLIHSEQIDNLVDQMATARKAFIGPHYARLLLEPAFAVTDEDMLSSMDKILASIADVYGDDYLITGVPMSNYDIAHAFSSDLLKVNLITLFSILLIVILSFRSLRLPILLVCIIEGAIWITFGISAVVNEPVFFISYLICLSIQMGATIDYAILLSDQYRAQRRLGLPPKESLIEALHRSLPTIATSGIILIVAGFIIGKWCSIYYIYSIGLLVSRGALVSVLLVLFLLPPLLLLCDRFIFRTKTEQKTALH